MNDSNPNSTTNSPVAAVASLPKLDPLAVMSALASPLRWPIIQLLADGREMNIKDGAAAAHCTAVNFSKHLGVMDPGRRGGMYRRRRPAEYDFPHPRRPTPRARRAGLWILSD